MIDDDFCPLPIPIQHFLSDGILVYKAQSEDGHKLFDLDYILALFILLILKILIALLIKEKRRVCSNTSKKDLKMKTLKLNYLVNFQEKSDYYVLYIYI
jgi:hypothetical protein